MAELSETGTPFDTGVRAATAVLVGRPAYWSYSSLKEIEACPRRYVLTRASYPDLWSGDGYPSVPSPASFFGDVVHDALEALVKALTDAGCESLSSEGAVAVLQPLGGIPAAVKTAMEGRLSRLKGNPRLNPEAFQRFARALGDRAEDARAQVQEFLCRMSFPAGTPKSSVAPTTDALDGAGPAFQRRPVGTGTHPEITLADEDLRLMGRVDLLTVSDGAASIVDYKTGAPDPGHVEQISLYTMLWGLDRVVNPQHVPVGQLTIAYPSRNVQVAPEDRAELDTLETSTRLRIATADGCAEVVPPEARPAPEVCGYCPVKGLCLTYWSTAVPNPDSVPDGEWFDYQGVVGPQNGVRSRWLLAPESSQKQLLLRTPPSTEPLVEGDAVRLLGIRREVDPETEATVAVMSTNTEVLILTRQAPSAASS
jgi:hypothetical protein